MTAGTLLLAFLQSILFLAVGWFVGNALLGRIWPERTFEWPERGLAAIAGGVVFSLGCMIVHIVSGGALFGIVGAVPVLAIAAIYVTRRAVGRPTGVPWLLLVGFAAMVLTLYAGPAISGGSSIRTGDPPWHLGWSEQLLAGDPIPTGPAPEFGRNAYPWGLHAVIATLVRLVPASTPVIAHEALHFLLVLGLPLAAACIARALDPRAGWAAAAAMSLIGGFGWVAAGEPDFVASPGSARYGADLVVASPNSVYESLPPALPRELGLVLLAVAGLLFLISRREDRGAFAAGVIAGIVGLISVPLFVSALLWAVALAIATRGGRWLARVLAAAVGVFALWAGPVASNYVAQGGFVDITPRLGVEWPLPVALASWGLLLPLAIAGVALARRSPAVAFVAATALLLALAVARGEFGWSLSGNATLLHQGRVWPPMHLLGAALAGVALVGLWRWRRFGPLIVVAVVGVGSISPMFASMRMTELIRDRTAGFDYARGDHEFVRRVASHLGPDDVLLVQGSDALAFRVFEFSGVKLARYDDARLASNDLRIRYADLAAAWDERMTTVGFDSDFYLIPAPEQGTAPAALERGTFGGRRWIMLPLVND